MSDQTRAIIVNGLRKRYGTVTAVDGVSFQVQRGEIFGMVGPNGSGKTTTIECIEGLRKPDEGQVSVLGLDPWRDVYELRERTGIQLQSANLPRRMRVEEALDTFASFYRNSRDWCPLLEGLGLAITKSIIDKHNGRIWLESIPGEGSTFTVALPIHQELPNA